ncbi:hypothetical protein DNI29_04345 [Hymenobacter sediminis]|uniref:hypothetical protein n=1 Tax=Hymenobacter sediminis TaxID=2218621 RepID=UPI000DA6A7D7|nr:hypothetical protein [Hymenobacter sediminis]RPD50033.1 hypothetical protein DNI29_04345 [Hymenobacter sediminis]
MNLPDPKELEDARWQQEFAGRKLAEFVATMREALQTPPADTPTARARYDRNLAFLRALEFFLTSNASLLNLLDQREEEMNLEMVDAQFKYTQMALDRDFYQREAQSANARYYQEQDLYKLLQGRFTQNVPTDV